MYQPLYRGYSKTISSLVDRASFLLQAIVVLSKQLMHLYRTHSIHLTTRSSFCEYRRHFPSCTNTQSDCAGQKVLSRTELSTQQSTRRLFQQSICTLAAYSLDANRIVSLLIITVSRRQADSNSSRTPSRLQQRLRCEELSRCHFAKSSDCKTPECKIISPIFSNVESTHHYCSDYFRIQISEM